MSWRSKKQSCVALSTTESEYMALSVQPRKLYGCENLIKTSKICSQDQLRIISPPFVCPRILNFTEGQNISISSFILFESK